MALLPRQKTMEVVARARKHDWSVAVVTGAIAIAALAIGSSLGSVHGPAIRPRVIVWSSALVLLVFGVIAVRRTAAGLGQLMSTRTIPSAGAAVRLVTTGVGYVIIICAELGLLDVPIDHLLVGAGLAGIVLGIAAQQSLGNVFASLVLLLAKPFTVGETIRCPAGAGRRCARPSGLVPDHPRRRRGERLLFLVTFEIDWAAYHHHLTLPVLDPRTGSADAGRQVLIAIAAAVITVVGVVFSITILALTLASQQFGPRMMRNFVRDVGNQVTLGVFVGTFVYSVLALGFDHERPSRRLSSRICRSPWPRGSAARRPRCPHLLHPSHRQVDPAARGDRRHRPRPDARHRCRVPRPVKVRPARPAGVGSRSRSCSKLIEERGAVVTADTSGYLQFVGYAQLVDIAARTDAVIRLDHRPGHFIVAGPPAGHRLAGGAAGQVALALSKAHVTGPHRTLMQDPVFAIDQLVEIAIRALSPAVNDTFTALTCIDWLSRV
jgi:small-conductance mechanosensitive channel